ncbi:MAG: hypothetical protein LBE49_07705, partial [Deltaproteobacteria bacterium]|nr:hypothetical protein [Deltaproteobacteria bacterium]
DGRFPSPYLRTEAEAEEELRLMYVAVTRAKDELTITVPLGSSLDNGGGSIPSRFLSGLSGRSVDLYSMGSLVSDDRPLSCGEEQESDPDDYDESQQFDPGDYDESQERPGAFGQNLNNKRPRQEKPPPHPLMRPIVKDKPPKPLEPGPEPKVGQMVKHTFYGLGRVLKIADGSAVIDFQYSGRKSVRIAFAKLTLLDD